jgi:hypothetical protein
MASNRSRVSRRRGLAAAVVVAVCAFFVTTGVAAAAPAGDGSGGVGPGSVAGADTGGAPSLSTTIDVNGGYVAAGVGLRNRGFGPIKIAGIPSGGTVVRAYLYWAVLNPAETPALARGAINSVGITGTRIGTGVDPCWGATAGWSYRADVTSIVKKNGTYNLTRFASGLTNGAEPSSGQALPLAEGASLVVVYKKLATATSPAYPRTRVQLYNGYQEEQGAGSTLTASWGFGATNPVPEVKSTFIGADGQSDFSEPASTVNGVAVAAADWDGTDPQAGPRYSIGNLWDTDIASVGRLVSPGNTGATIKVTGGPDCLIWVAQVTSAGFNGAADTDRDALLDGWEANGYDANGDQVVNVDLPTYGSSVVHKDLYVEMDYMGAEATCPCHLPLAADLERIVTVFATAPFANNPDNTAGIRLHLDAGAARGATYNLGGGNLVAHDDDLNPVATEFNALKAANFDPVRAKIFYYMIWAHGYDGDSSSGNAFAIPNDSFVVTLGLWPNHGTSDVKVGTFVHEFGHDLGLLHGGNQDINYKPNYLSVMSYAFQVTGVPRTGTTAPDFGYSRSLLPSLDEASLNESVGLDSSAANTYRTRWFCPDGAQATSPGTANGPLDWNCNGTIGSPASVDLNRDSGLGSLTGFNDWANLVYGGGAVGPGIPAAPRPAPAELTLDEYQSIPR